MSKIEGIPEGWELVRIGCPRKREFYLDFQGQPKRRQNGDELSNVNYVIVRAIAPLPPKYVPWTFETCLRGCWVRRKGTETTESKIVAIYHNGVKAGQAEHIEFDELFRFFEQLDGTPCGTVEP